MNKLSLIFIIALLTACGGGGSGVDSSNGVTFNGNEEPSTIDATNAKNIGETAGESIEKAANTSSIPAGIDIQTEVNITEITQMIISSIDTPLLPSGIDLSASICSSGSASSNTPSATSGPATLVFTYNNCRLKNSLVTFSGKAVIRFSELGDTTLPYTISYINFKVSQFGLSEVTLNLVLDCTSVNNCTYNSDFIGSDGNTHRVAEISFSGNSESGYSGTATFYHARYGKSSITATNVSYGSCGNSPDGGSITYVSSRGSSGSISFNSDCTANGTWTNNGLSGSF